MKHFKFINYPQNCLKSLKRVYFSPGSFTLDADAKAVSRQNAACLQDNPLIDFILEGHCDIKESGGTDPAPGNKRANAVMDYLVRLGVDKNRLEIEDRGASKPIDPGENETAFAKNRRVEFIPKFETGDCNGEDTCGRNEDGGGCENCDRDSLPDCNGKDKPEDCFYEEEGCQNCDRDSQPDCIGKDKPDDCFYQEKCDKKEEECTPDESCDDCDDEGDCDCDDKEDGCPDCEENEGCGSDKGCQDCDKDEECPNDRGPCGEGGDPQPPPSCEYCEGEGPGVPPPGCGIMEIIPFFDCRSNESGTPNDKGGGGQSA